MNRFFIAAIVHFVKLNGWLIYFAIKTDLRNWFMTDLWYEAIYMLYLGRILYALPTSRTFLYGTELFCLNEIDKLREFLIDPEKLWFLIFCVWIFLQILLTPPDEGPRVKGQRIKLQDIVDGLYKPQPTNGTWINCKCICCWYEEKSKLRDEQNACSSLYFSMNFTT